MWFILRMTFWLGVVLVLLSNTGSQTTPNSQINASEAFSAAKNAMTDFEHFCERQQEACAVAREISLLIAAVSSRRESG